MARELKIHVEIIRKNLSPQATVVLGQLDSFDWIIFTSKNAVAFFVQELRERNIRFPREPHVAAVGPKTAKALHNVSMKVHVMPERFAVAGVLQRLGAVKGKRILFPRSAIAPADAVRTLRAKGATVRVLPLYTVAAAPLAELTRRALVEGKYGQLFFSSPSGVHGFMKQLSSSEKRIVQKISARCIGPTTAKAARAAGFTAVSITHVV